MYERASRKSVSNAASSTRLPMLPPRSASVNGCWTFVKYFRPTGMRVSVFPNRLTLARAAARDAASRIRAAVAAFGHARIVAATGTSQMAFLDQLTREPDLDWSTVELFHLDEYVGLSDDHPASFRRYLRERLIQPAGIVRFHLIDGRGDPNAVCEDLGRKLA